jgi:steroid 5-alpha reductase family enzyme
MSVIALWIAALPAISGLTLVAWAVATVRRNVGLVDIFWSLFLLLAAAVFALLAPSPGARAWLVLVLVAIWSLRLAAYLAARNWNAPEDHRYRAMRARYEPGFTWKSLYRVFGPQAVLAWLISAPLAVAMAAPAPLGVIEAGGAALTLFGIVWEATADAQLARFRADPANAGRVMDRGLWRYSRHPNYFGEFCVWWGLYLVALGAGGWWTAFAPLLMTVLLLRVSGVALLERDIGERRPAYRDYVARTNAFFPGPAKETRCVP